MNNTDGRITELERRVRALEQTNARMAARIIALEVVNGKQPDMKDSILEKNTSIPVGAVPEKPTDTYKYIADTVEINTRKEDYNGNAQKETDNPTRETVVISQKETIDRIPEKEAIDRIHEKENTDGVPEPPNREQAKTAKSNLTDDLTAELMEVQIGGTWLNRIGIVAFVFGLGFFLKYSFDNNWIGPTGRVIMGILAGMGLLTAGEYSQRKGYRIFAQGLTGGGIASLYFAIFASFSFYHLISQITAFGIMILITVTAVLLSVRYDSFATAILGIVGGYLTPFFLNTGKPNPVGLFSYIALLNCGVLALAAFKKWRPINIISFIFSLVISVLWAVSPNSADSIWTNQLFYSIFFVIFALVAVFYNCIHRIRTQNDDLILITANAISFFALSYDNLMPEYDPYMGFLPFILAVFYFVMGYLAWQRNRDDRFLVLSLWGLSIFFLTITMPVQLQGKWITAAWAVEAAILFWLGIKNTSYALRMVALGILGIALVRLLGDSAAFTYSYGQNLFWPIINVNMVPFLACICASFIISRLYYLNRSVIESKENPYWSWLTVLGILLSTIYLNLETVYFCQNRGVLLFGNGFPTEEAKVFSIAVIWFTASLILIWTGSINKLFDPQLAGIASFAIGLYLLFGPGSYHYFNSNTSYWPVLNLRTVPYIFGVLSSLYTSRKVVSTGINPETQKYLSIGAAVAANAIILGYLSLEVFGFYRVWAGSLGLMYNDIDKATQMTLSVVWTLYAIGLMAAGFIWKSKPLRLMSIVIFAGTIVKVFSFDLSYLDTIYRIVSFIVLGGLLVAVSFLYQKYSGRILGTSATDDRKGVDG